MDTKNPYFFRFKGSFLDLVCLPMLEFIFEICYLKLGGNLFSLSS